MFLYFLDIALHQIVFQCVLILKWMRYQLLKKLDLRACGCAWKLNVCVFMKLSSCHCMVVVRSLYKLKRWQGLYILGKCIHTTVQKLFFDKFSVCNFYYDWSTYLNIWSIDDLLIPNNYHVCREVLCFITNSHSYHWICSLKTI